MSHRETSLWTKLEFNDHSAVLLQMKAMTCTHSLRLAEVTRVVSISKSKYKGRHVTMTKTVKHLLMTMNTKI